jgi:hypothetical protein
MQLPYGYRIETGGSIEESAKVNTALVVVFPVMAIAMLAMSSCRASANLSPLRGGGRWVPQSKPPNKSFAASRKIFDHVRLRGARWR